MLPSPAGIGSKWKSGLLAPSMRTPLPPQSFSGVPPLQSLKLIKKFAKSAFDVSVSRAEEGAPIN